MKRTTTYFQNNPYKLLAFVAAASAVAVGFKFVKFQNSRREALLSDIASERDMLDRLLVTQGAARRQIDIDFRNMMSKTLHHLVRQRNNVNMWGELKAFLSFR